MSTNKELIARFEQLKRDILLTTEVDVFETPLDKEKRIKRLLGSYREFAEYYFPNYCSAPTADFQHRDFTYIYNHPNIIALLQWFREAAKSVHANIIFPCFLKFNGRLTGMIVGCTNQDDAIAKLCDLQAQFETNQRIKNDFGPQMLEGNWADGNFATRDGSFFRAFGRHQSPRGVRFRENRPNYGVLDDIDDKKLVKNEKLSAENYAWCREEFMAALSIKQWWVVIPENKFHKNTVTARFEADKEIKTYLSRVNMLDKNGRSSWHQNYTDAQCNAKIAAMGFISAQREYFNNPIEEGTIFQDEWFRWAKMLPLNQYDYVVTYTDPSYKNTDKSDYKATVLMGKKGLKYHVIKVFVDKVSIREMFEWMYLLDAYGEGKAQIFHYMEDAFLQDLMWGELESLATEKGRMLPVVHDRRSKPDKFQRIEALQPLFQRGLIEFNENEREDPGMLRLKGQFLAFEKGSRTNDDAPDAVEGGIFKLNEKTMQSRPVVTGRRHISKHRY